MHQATLSSKFQLSIPKQIRDLMHLQPGHKLAFVLKGSVIELVPVKSIKEIRGILKGANPEGYRDRQDRV